MNSILELPKLKKRVHPYIGVIVQARMTSKRFPGKSMALLDGKPVIQHVLEHCKQIRPIDKVILAVPDTDESEPMLELAEKLLIDNFCGDELNVLERYYKAAIYYKLEIIVRITGDCPFINPRVCSEVLQLLLWRKLDYASNIFPIRTYPKGLDCEVMTMDALEAAYKLSITDYEKEHVTPFLQNEEGIKRANVEQKINTSDLNWCIDFPSDIARLEKEMNNRKIH